MSLFNKKIPIVYTIALGAICSIASFIFVRIYSAPAASAVENAPKVSSANCNYTVDRLNGYKYVKPLLDQAPECESQRLSGLKQAIVGYINAQQQSGIISSASVYIKEFSSDDWVYINPENKYTPGSLLKVPVMMCVLKMAETNPSFLEKKLIYDPKIVKPMTQTYNSPGITPGKSYSVKELLASMVANSDNAAAMMLSSNIDYTIFKKMFVDLKLPVPDLTDSKKFMEYTIGARDFSAFLADLYNGSYLTITASEYATSLLAQSTFKEGLARELPPGVKLAHKFGEAAMSDGSQLHESGIIYIGNTAYLLTVMTKGNDIKKQADVLANVSRLVYDKLHDEAL